MVRYRLKKCASPDFKLFDLHVKNMLTPTTKTYFTDLSANPVDKNL